MGRRIAKTLISNCKLCKILCKFLVQIGHQSAGLRIYVNPAIDSLCSEADTTSMKRWFTLLLVVGALLGLFGQEAAFASVISVGKSGPVIVAASMSADCAEMMGRAKQTPQPDQPCQGMTPDCVAKMGCAIAVALIPSLLSADPNEYRAAAPRQIPVTPLVGRETSPEPHPPSHLA